MRKKALFCNKNQQKENDMAQRSFWIDHVKVICMIGVYLLHSEAYYGFGDIQYGMLITPFYVNAFFFVSGYLMLINI